MPFFKHAAGKEQVPVILGGLIYMYFSLQIINNDNSLLAYIYIYIYIYMALMTPGLSKDIQCHV